jgi:hypothetical protein
VQYIVMRYVRVQRVFVRHIIMHGIRMERVRMADILVRGVAVRHVAVRCIAMNRVDVYRVVVKAVAVGYVRVCAVHVHIAVCAVGVLDRLAERTRQWAATQRAERQPGPSHFEEFSPREFTPGVAGLVNFVGQLPCGRVLFWGVWGAFRIRS